jgi:type IV pilus assembly protein PilE
VPAVKQPFGVDKGFTLIEVMIVVVVIAILAAIAIPSYQYFVRNAQRADGMSALMDIRTAQERWRANYHAYAGPNPDYPGNVDIDSLVPFGATSPDGFWTLAITHNSASTFRVTATKTDGLPDARCSTMVLAFGVQWDKPGTATPGLISQGPANCWKR